jgi:hypothetical protein
MMVNWLSYELGNRKNKEKRVGWRRLKDNRAA